MGDGQWAMGNAMGWRLEAGGGRAGKVVEGGDSDGDFYKEVEVMLSLTAKYFLGC